MPNVVGKKRGPAEAALGAFGFPATVQRQDVSTKSQGGVVLSQSPAANQMVNKGTTVTITVGHYVAPTHDHDATTTTSAHDDHVHDVHQRHDHHAVTVRPVRVAVLGGGRSSEHEVSLASAASVRAGLEQAGHVPIAIEIGRDGVWRRDGATVAVEPGRGLDGVDVVFPVLHGPFGEDGTVQGLLECLDVPYVGAGVLSSALCMDKVMFKELMAHAGLPQVRYRAVRAEEFASERELRARGPALARHAGVRQAGAARIVGRDRPRRPPRRSCRRRSRPRSSTTRWRSWRRPPAASRSSARCSAASDPIASEPGEIVLAKGESGWYDYEAKYTPGGMQLIVPRGCPERARERIREIAVSAFLRTGCYGLARVDFFVDGERVLLNELNTIPGFTSTSVYASLFEASGIPYAELLDRLVQLALERHAAERRHRH